MRDARRQQAPAMASLLVLLLVGAATLVQAPGPLGQGLDLPAPERTGFRVPPLEQDQDHDGWHDDEDAFDGDRMAAVRFTGLPDDARVRLHTEDDHHRTGKGGALEWPHVIDMDPLGDTPGSAAWVVDNLRSGTSVRGRASGETVLVINVKEQGLVALRVEVWQESTRVAHGDIVPTPAPTQVLWNAQDAPADIQAEAWILAGPAREEAMAAAARWAPTVHFDSGERLFPVSGTALSAVDGFYPVQPDLRPWLRTFNNGHDRYRLLLDHFNGDAVIDHRDVVARLDALAPLDFHRPVVHAHATWGQDLTFVIQYWFLYPYNFVLDSTDRDIPALAHKGDREFVQLVFEDLDAALEGTPVAMAFSQHYRGVVLPWPEDLAVGGWDVYVARGSHASYPAPGDNRRATPALVGHHDRFDGAGTIWTPDDYTLELLDRQPWFREHLWGPHTRTSRDIGVASAPLLRHDFRYAFHEPSYWQAGLAAMDRSEARRLYGDAP